MSYDVMVIAGTADSRAVIEEKLKENRKVLACVATDLGARMLEAYPVDVHIGRLDVQGFTDLIREKDVKEVVDASHPFARIVTETVREACMACGIPCRRQERSHIDYDYEGIHVVDDVEEAICCLNETDGNILLTTGVNTAVAYFSGVKNAKDRLYIRVLDTAGSYEGCKKAGFPDDHVFGEMPPFSLEDNLGLIRKTHASVLVSKDSGKTGGVDIKAEACKKADIPMILIRRPEDLEKLER